MPVQPVTAAEKKGRMIRAATELFHEEGIKVTTPEDVARASGGNVNEFYHYFHNKEVLIHEVIRAEVEAIKSGQAPIVCEFSSWRQLGKWFFTYVELQRSFNMTRTCLFGKVANEIAERDTLIREDVSAIFEFVKGRIVDFFKKEKAEGRLVKDANEGRSGSFPKGISKL